MLKNPSPESNEILNFHLTAEIGSPENNFIMNRGDKVKTISITQIVNENNSVNMHYNDLLKSEIKSFTPF